jgi:prepilin-type N-terminal cleavage/methylation domain-containing protein
MRNKKNIKSGFTLIEIIVSLSVFSAVILIILGAVLSIMNLQKKTNAFRAAQENLSYAFESIAKEMRTGTRYASVSGDFPSHDITFKNDQGNQVVYKVGGGGNYDGQIVKCVDGNPCVPLTSSELVVDNLTFVIKGAGGNDGQQPWVRILVSCKVGAGTKYETSLFLQTAVTQRKRDS